MKFSRYRLNRLEKVDLYFMNGKAFAGRAVALLTTNSLRFVEIKIGILHQFQYILNLIEDTDLSDLSFPAYSFLFLTRNLEIIRPGIQFLLTEKWIPGQAGKDKCRYLQLDSV